MDKARRFDTLAWLMVGVLGIAGLVYAGVMAGMVLGTMNWDLFSGKLDWSPGHEVTSAPRPQVPPQMQMPAPQLPPPTQLPSAQLAPPPPPPHLAPPPQLPPPPR